MGWILALFLGALVSPASAVNISFAWDANPEADLAGYKLFIGPSSRNYTNHVALGRVTSHVIVGLPDSGVYYFAITAVNSNGLESGYSTELRYPNLPPTITAIADRTISEDAAQQSISLSGISPGAGESQSLQITATSSNPSLIPNPTVNYTSGDSTAALLFTPIANANGAAQIIVTLDDGQTENNTATASFTVTVTAVNDPPTLAAIANQTVAEDVPAVVALQVGDIDTPADNLTFRATSSNATLAPTNNITFPGSGTSRSVSVTPAPNQFGTATITVTVSDGSLSTNRAFTLTVTSSPDAPTISAIAPVTVSEDTETALLPFTVSDAETAASNLTVRISTSNPTLIPTNRVILSGTGSARNVRLRPSTNQHGSATVTLTVSDGSLTASTGIELTVLPVNDPPTISAIADRNLWEDMATQFIPFTVSDIETASNDLTVTAASSDHSVIPLANIALGISATNRTIRILPVTNAVGSATVTLTVSDGESTASEAFTVTYLATNDVPFVSQPPDLTINKQHLPPPIPFTVGDVETPASQLAITFSSTNFPMQRVTNMFLSGSGSNRVLTMTPTPGMTGTTLLSIKVSDGAATNTVYFRFTITGSNNPPVLSVPGTLAGNAGAIIPVPGMGVSDLDVGTNALRFTLTAPNGTLNVSTSVTAGVRAAQVTGNNSGAVTINAPLAALNATLDNASGVSYASRADFGGTETLVVSANDNGHAGLGGPQSDTENILIQVTGTGGNNLEVWRARYFSAGDLQDPAKEATVWGDLADPDNDGRHNLMEFALGLNPLASEPQDAAFVSQTLDSGGNQFLTLTFNARIDESLVQYVTEVSADNALWAASTLRIAATPVNSEFERVTHRDTVPITPANARFIRLRVVKNSP